MKTMLSRIKNAFFVLMGYYILDDGWPFIKPDIYYEEEVLPNGDRLLIPKLRPLK